MGAISYDRVCVCVSQCLRMNTEETNLENHIAAASSALLAHSYLLQRLFFLLCVRLCVFTCLRICVYVGDGGIHAGDTVRSVAHFPH